MTLQYIILLLVAVVRVARGWHDLTNSEFHCWPDSASASNIDTMDCDGIDMDWVVAPPEEVVAEEPFSVTYSLTIDDGVFWEWAVNDADYNVFGDISSTSITTAAGAQSWCEDTVCPNSLEDVEEDNCCIWHVNVHSCPLSESAYCGPWIQPTGSTYTHSAVLWGPIQTVNWTSDVDGLYETGTNQLIAHFKIASFQVALRSDINVLPKSECGNNKCEKDDGEDCKNCPADCGTCPLETWVIGLIAAIGAAIVLAIAAVIAYFRIKQQRLLWDESWIIPYEEMSAAGNRKALMGSAISIAASSKGSMKGNGMSNMQQQAMVKQMFCKTCMVKGKTLAIKDVPKQSCSLSKKMRIEVRELRNIEHANVVRFLGACLEVPHVCVATEYCPKGSLADVLQNEDVPLNWGFRFSMAGDVARGMAHLHSRKIYHGNLKSTNCIIDDRWTVKVTDFGLATLRAAEPGPEDEDYEEESAFKQRRYKVYRAPELLDCKQPEPTPAADVYAYAIILVEIGTREDPYGDEGGPDAVEVTWKPALPDFSDETMGDKCPSKFDYLQLIRDCWMDNPTARPSFTDVRKALMKMNPSKLSPVDIMMAMMEKYSKHLESIVAERTKEMIVEKEKADKLLYSMIPKAVADELKKGKQIKAEQYGGCTIYFSDIVGFTKLSGGSSAVQVIALLNKLYVCFDSIIDNYDVYKVETIGDAYMVVSGIPKPNGIRHAREICNMALDLRDSCETFVIPHKPGEKLKIRIGAHSGPACAGVVGLKMPRYCLFGDTVNTASRMESNGEEYKVHISSTTYDLLIELGGFKLEKRGVLPIKGKGDMTTWWVTGRDAMAKKMNEEISERKISGVSNADSGYTEVTGVADTQAKGTQDSAQPSRRTERSKSMAVGPAPASATRRNGSAARPLPPVAKEGWGDADQTGLTSIA